MRRQAHVRDVDPAEHAVPVAVVRLALVEVLGGQPASRSVGHRRDRRGGAEHLLVEVVDLAVLDLEVAPEAAAQPAHPRLAPLPAAAGRPASKAGALVGGQGPLAHLEVGRRSAGRPGRSGRCPASQSDGVTVAIAGSASSAAKKRSTQPSAPQQCSNVSGQAPNFSPSSPMQASRSPLRGRVRDEVTDHLLDPAERDAVAEPPVRAEDRQEAALVLGRVRAPQVVVVERRRPEVGIVEDRPAVAGLDDRASAGRAPRRARRARPRPAGGRRSARSRRPSGGAGRPGRARAATAGPARSSRPRGARPGRSRRAPRAGRGRPAARPASQSSSGPL